ncbi:MAG TPA: hypothetical protein VFW85_08370 [Gaiellaceae bacterium]|nr:hypothetical protein [Gaiellaceae bacterium]
MTAPSWLIARSRAVEPPSGQLLNSAYAVQLTRDSSTRDVVVEFADVSTVASNGYAEEVARRFVCDAEPPQSLLVQRSGSVKILVGPLEPSADVQGDAGLTVTRRARSRGRRTG